MIIYLELFWTFFKIGLFTFGGGYAMLPLIQQAVMDNNWIAEQDFINFIAVSESTPGPFAINMATYVGATVGGDVFGAFFATLGVVIPSFVIILLVAKIYDKFRKNKVVEGCMTGLKPAVVGLIGAALINIATTVLFPAGVAFEAFKTPAIYASLALFSITCVLAFKKVNPIIIICLSAVVGILVVGVFFPHWI